MSSHSPTPLNTHITARPEGALRTVSLVMGSIFHLSTARLRLHRFQTSDVSLFNKLSLLSESAGMGEPHASEKLIANICWIIPRMARRVPFRSDCLVQALAAQGWLEELGISSRIVIGVRPDPASRIDSHAWLVRSDTTLLGGDIKGYQSILGD